VSQIHRRRKTPAVILLVLAAVAVGAALVVRPHLAADSSATGASNVAQTTSNEAATQTTAPTSGTVGAKTAARTSSAPFTIKSEPTHVATDSPVPTTSGRVQVVLSYAGFQPSGTVQANGFAAGVIEDGGTCTLTLTHGSSVVTATSTAAADATTTSCGLLETAPGLAPGTWNAVLSYSSPHAHGTSDSVEVTVR
jgi:hypothetical protein